MALVTRRGCTYSSVTVRPLGSHMLLWIVFSVLTAGVVGTLLWWYRHAPAEALDADADVFVYADQLSQIDADRAKGLLTDAEAVSARAEVGRRLLARAAASMTGNTETARGSARLAVAAAVAIPVAAIALYVGLGSPGLPDVPHAGRTEAAAARDGVDALIARVEDRLRAAPEDGNGWDVIAPIYLRMERYGQAAEAFANANRLLGETPKRLAGFAQSEILANNGIVNANAKIAAERLLALEPDRLDARMWLALAKEQDGRFNDALADYRALLSAPQMTPAMTSAVEVRIGAVERLARGEKIEPGQDAADAPPGRPPGPADQQAMIEGMVARLASRLQTDGNDPSGWVQLMRSYKVLGRNDDAVKALQDARKALAGNGSSLDQINTAAAELGIEAAAKGSEQK